MLKIEGLSATKEELKILNDFDLSVENGQIHAIMGPNGAGKSTLSRVLAGDPSFDEISGKVSFFGKDLFSMEPEERVFDGLFVSFQYPVEIPGLSNAEFLYSMHQSLAEARKEKRLEKAEFQDFLEEKMNSLGISYEFLSRDLNHGFSGGEKKRNEILQMAVANPCLAILDETDSGLDVDALRMVAQGVNDWMSQEKAVVLITHYQRLLDYIQPDFVHIMQEGKIVASGDASLAKEIEKGGYQVLNNVTDKA